MQLAQLHMVKQILETGSLSKTALRLNWAQSVVSRQLAAFENECGGRIFYRNGRGVVLTELGERILPLVDIIINAADEMAQCGAELRNELVGEVKVAIGPQIASLLSAPLFARLKKQHPNIRLSVWEAYSGMKTDLKEGRTDVAVFMHSFFHGDEDDQVIGEIDTHLIGLPDSPATSSESIDFSDIEKLPLILPSAPNAWRRAIDQFAAKVNVRLNVAAEANASSPTAALVHAGVGYLIAPMMLGAAAEKMGWVGADVQAGRLRSTRIIAPGLTSKLVVSRGVSRSRCVDAVTRLIVTILHELMEPSPDDPEFADTPAFRVATA